MNTDEVLRHALDAAADEFHPSPDAWQQNGRRVHRRRRNTQIASVVGAAAVIGASFGAVAHNSGPPASTPTPGSTATLSAGKHIVGPVHKFYTYRSGAKIYSAYLALVQNGANPKDLKLCETEQLSNEPIPTSFADCSSSALPRPGQHIGTWTAKEPTEIPYSPKTMLNFGTIGNDVTEFTVYTPRSLNEGKIHAIGHKAEILRAGPVSIFVALIPPPGDPRTIGATGTLSTGHTFVYRAPKGQWWNPPTH